jgi:ABC-type transport system involved in cytochrome bd biosynthesis fused ATPase/permease subunit
VLPLQAPHAEGIRLWWQLLREAGKRHALGLAGLALLGTLLEASGLGLAVSVLLGAKGLGGGTAGEPGGAGMALPGLPPGAAIGLLILVMTLRSLLQALSAIAQERLRSGFIDRLRSDLLARVLLASSQRLDQVGRGDLLGLLLSDIDRSVLALDQGIRCLQASIALAIYATGVMVVGRGQALTLLLGLAAAAGAALARRSDAWGLGQRQSQLNGSLHRTVGDGLHGLKAIRAAGAEAWLLQRFASESRLYRQVLRLTVRRQALFSALRDTLVVVVVGLWLLLGRSGLTVAAITTTLLLAQRAAGSLGMVISSRRFCLGALPGYEALRQLRHRLGDPGSPLALHGWSPGAPLRALCWEGDADILELQPGQLVVVAGPSGSGKTTLLDGFCGQLGEETSRWRLELTSGEQLLLEGPAGVRRWRSLLAYAPQSAVLFEGSLRDNLLLQRSDDPTLPPRQLEDWLEQLELTHLLGRPGGLDGPLNLSIDCFSGGEIHRLGLLRAWLQDKPIEVLDEPTAFLDGATARRVRQIIAERSLSKLVVVCSHDEALIALASTVVRRHPADRAAAVARHGGGRAGGPGLPGNRGLDPGGPWP